MFKICFRLCFFFFLWRQPRSVIISSPIISSFLTFLWNLLLRIILRWNRFLIRHLLHWFFIWLVIYILWFNSPLWSFFFVIIFLLLWSWRIPDIWIFILTNASISSFLLWLFYKYLMPNISIIIIIILLIIYNMINIYSHFLKLMMLKWS
jgi:hypothetical protein